MKNERDCSAKAAFLRSHLIPTGHRRRCGENGFWRTFWVLLRPHHRRTCLRSKKTKMSARSQCGSACNYTRQTPSAQAAIRGWILLALPWKALMGWADGEPAWIQQEFF